MKPLRLARAYARRVLVETERAKLKIRGQRRLADALGKRTCEMCERIEQKRAELMADQSPLTDGSCGPAGPYDEGQSIAAACGVSKRATSARLLYSIAAEYGPKTILELGTNVGISSSYLAAAGGKVTTLEASPYRLRVARKLHESLGLDVDYVQGLFTDTLGPTLERLGRVDMAFIDGHHQYRPTLDYFEEIAAKAAPGCVFIFDDIRWSSGMRQAWAELRRDSRFATVADLGDMGLGIFPA